MSRDKCHSKLWLYFAGVVFGVVAAVLVLIIIVWFLMFKLGYIDTDPFGRRFPVLLVLFGSLLIGGAVAVFVGKLIIRPIQNISEAFNELSRGNFDIRVPTDEKVEEIREMAVRFNAMVYDLSHIETLRNDFVVSVSHEFKTPLAAVSGYATLLQTPNLSAQQHDRYVEVILENTKRLSALSSNILTLSKLENQETLPQKTEFRLDEQLRRQVLLLEEKWSGKGIEFDIELPKTVYYGCEGLLSQVWSNLIENAIKASYQDGVIRISIQEDERSVSVSVADYGAGMSQEVQKHIFDKFYQGDSSRKAEGNGLGLSLVRRIVDLCGGRIDVESSPGNGADFCVTLPKE